MKSLKRNYKFTAIILILFMFIGQFASVAIANQGLTIGTMIGSPGQTIRVPVTLSSSGQVAGIQMDIGYNQPLLEFKGVEKGNLPPTFIAESNEVNGKQRMVILSLDGGEIPEGYGTIAYLIFQVSEQALSGQFSDLTLNNVTISNVNGIAITSDMSLIPGRVTVESASQTKLSLPDIQAAAGETIRVPLTLTSDGGVSGIQLDLAYAPQLINYMGIEKGSLSDRFIVESNVVNGKQRILIFSPQGDSIAAGSGNVAVLTFKMADTALAGQISELGMSQVTLSDGEGNDVHSPITIKPGKVTVAMSAQQTSLSMGDVTALPGATVQIPIHLNSAGNVSGIQLDVNYNRELLTLLSLVKGDLTEEYEMDSHDIDGKERIVIYSPTNQVLSEGEGSIAVLTFRVSSHALAGQSGLVEMGHVVLSDSHGNPLNSQPTLKNGQVTVADFADEHILRLEDYQAAPGEIIDVPLKLTSSGNVGGLQLDFGYNSQLLQFVGIQKGDLPDSFIVESNEVAGKQRIIIFSPAGASLPEGTVTTALLTFQVAETVSSGQASLLEMENVVLSDSTGGNLNQPFTYVNGMISVSGMLEPNPDRDRDGIVDLYDIITAVKSNAMDVDAVHQQYGK